MLPISESFENLDDLILNFEDTDQSKTQTFGINMIDNIITGKIDGLEALKQSIYLALSIEADKYIIYPYTYGVNTIDLIGKPSYYIMAVLPERIKETLLTDNRIIDVHDFEFTVSGNKITARFTVDTIYGDTEQETVVTY